MATEVKLLYQLVQHCSLTLVSNSLAWDWVPVQTQRLLPSNQNHQEQDLGPAHGSHVSAHSSELALSDGSRNQSVDRGGLERAPGSLPDRKKNQHISWKQQFTFFIDLVVYQKQFCHNSFYDMHIFQRAAQNPSYIQAVLKDKFLTLTTCSIKLNMVIKIHNNVKQK